MTQKPFIMLNKPISFRTKDTQSESQQWGKKAAQTVSEESRLHTNGAEKNEETSLCGLLLSYIRMDSVGKISVLPMQIEI